MAQTGYDPSIGQWRTFWEDRLDADSCFIEGVPPVPGGSDLTDHDFLNENLTTQTQELTDDSIRPAGLGAGSDLTKGTTGGAVNTQLDFEMNAVWLAMLQTRGRTPTVLTASESYRHILAPSETDVEFPLSRYGRIFRDDAVIESFANLQISQLTINAAIRSFITAQYDFLFQNSTEIDEADPQTESGSPERPVLRGKLTYAQATAADPTICVRVQNAGTGVVEVKLGTATAYGAGIVTVTEDGWVQMVDESGDQLGDDSSPVEIYVGDISGWTNSDEWYFLADATNLWTSSFPTIGRINEIDVYVQVEGAREKARGGTLTIATPKALDEAIGGLQPCGIKSDGNRAVSGSLDIEYNSAALKTRLIHGEPFSLEFVMGSRTVIGSSTDKYAMSFYMPKCTFNGQRPTIAGPNGYNTNFGFSAAADAGDPLPDDLTITIDNGIADLLAV